MHWLYNITGKLTVFDYVHDINYVYSIHMSWLLGVIYELHVL